MADNDISISGSGKINGGEYGKISISGSGAIVGGIRCEEIRVSGSASADGEINCSGDVKIAGSFKCKGKLSAAGELKIAGSCRTDGEVVGNVIKIAGSFCSGGKIAGKEIKVSGSIGTINDIEGEQVKLSGSAEIGGLLSAEKIEIELADRGQMKISQIGGTDIEVYGSEKSLDVNFIGLFKLHRSSRAGKLVCSIIEGDNITLSNTECQTVRGKNIVIGENCVIGTVEYSEQYTVCDSALVNHSEKV